MVSIFLANHNKTEALRYTLISLARQKASFPFEVCLVDDGSERDPLPFIEDVTRDLDFKYRRYTPGIGFPLSQGRCIELANPEANIIVVQSVDVLYLGTDTLERLVAPVEPGRFTLAGVKNIQVNPGSFATFEKFANSVNCIWNAVKGIHVYSGSDRPGGDWLFFLGALTRGDFFRIRFPENGCDVVVQHRLKETGMKPVFLDDVRAVHQWHVPNHLFPCPIMDKCEYTCGRKRSHR